MEKIIVISLFLFGIYIMVLLAIAADLWSGVRKAKAMGIARTSFGYRKTLDKVARYYNVMLALTVVDFMQMGSLWYLEKFYQYTWPIFPVVTMVGAIGICLIEIKSIYEKAEDKAKFREVGELAGKIIANKDDLKEIFKEVSEFMQENKEEKK